MNALKLYTDGRIETHDIREQDFDYKFQAMQKAIDCDCVDIVHAQNLGDPYCLVVDDEGLLKDKPYINLIASYLYGAESHGQPLCGDVLIMKDSITDEGEIETVGLDDSDIRSIYSLLAKPEATRGLSKIVSMFRK